MTRERKTAVIFLKKIHHPSRMVPTARSSPRARCHVVVCMGICVSRKHQEKRNAVHVRRFGVGRKGKAERALII